MKEAERRPPVKPVKVALLLSEGAASRGGIGRIMANLDEELGERHPDIRARRHATRLTGRPVLNHLSTPFALARFAISCAAGQVDIAHINIAPRGSTWRKMLFARTARRFGAKLVLHLHGSAYDEWFHGLTPARRRGVAAFFQGADAVVAMGDYWARFLIDELGMPAAKVHLIANGVADRPVSPGSAEGAPPVLAVLGIVGERKGTDVLLAALASEAMRDRPWRAIIGGNGEVEKARRSAAELGLADRVEFTGWVGPAEVDAILRQADIYILPSRQENQPMSILEAMACALPVLSTRIGAIPEQVIEGETGLLVPAGDAPALAGALEKLLADPALCRSMGTAGQARQRRLFSIRTGADRFAALYRGLVG